MKSKYHSAMEKITVSDMAEKRILENLSNRNIVSIENTKKSYHGWVKPMGAFAACFSVLLAVVLIYSSYISNNDSAQFVSAPKLVGTENKGSIVGREQSKQVDMVGGIEVGAGSGSEVAVGAGVSNGASDIVTGNATSGITGSPAGGVTGSVAGANAQKGKDTGKTAVGSNKLTNTQGSKGSPKTTVTDNNSQVSMPGQKSQPNKQTVPAKNNDIVVSTQQPPSNGVTVGNPIVQVKDLNELKKAVTYQLLVPRELPVGYKIENISVITGSMAQIIYNTKDREDDKIVYRTSSGTEDISGDYSTYETVEAINAKATEVTLKGSKTFVNLAIWSQDGCTFSLSFSSGANKEAVMLIVNSLGKLQ